MCDNATWNGNGYPQGISGEDVALLGRIAGLADVLEVLTKASIPPKCPRISSKRSEDGILPLMWWMVPGRNSKRRLPEQGPQQQIDWLKSARRRYLLAMRLPKRAG
jgi:hypothetical protein